MKYQREKNEDEDDHKNFKRHESNKEENEGKESGARLMQDRENRHLDSATGITHTVTEASVELLVERCNARIYSDKYRKMTQTPTL